jgi:hypothetical protein
MKLSSVIVFQIDVDGIAEAGERPIRTLRDGTCWLAHTGYRCWLGPEMTAAVAAGGLGILAGICRKDRQIQMSPL